MEKALVSVIQEAWIGGVSTRRVDELVQAMGMTGDDWADAEARRLAFLIRGEAGQYHLTAWGEPQPDKSFFVALNASHEPVPWVAPSLDAGRGWERLIDTDAYVSGGGRLADHRSFADGEVFEVAPRSLVVMIRGG